jgi:SAM-dependent methyltransferase
VGIVGQLRSYADRRLRIPVEASDLVVDIGGGDQPHWRADVVVDRYPDEADAAQRLAGGGARVDRPLFAVDAASLPFRSGAFGYAVCSHTLEHVTDPAGAVAEMCRVAHRGYIEVPEAGAAKVMDFPTHLWWCSLEDGELVFRAKTRRDFDPDIARFVTHREVQRQVTSMMSRSFDRTIIALQWEGSVPVRVEGDPDVALMAVGSSDMPARSAVAQAGRLVSSGIAKATWSRRRRRRPLRYGDLLDRADFGSLDASVRVGVHISGTEPSTS